MPPPPSPSDSREIRNVALLDLTGAQAAAALDGVTRIANVATILVPESLLAWPAASPWSASLSPSRCPTAAAYGS
jgi:hypothetical protein